MTTPDAAPDRDTEDNEVAEGSDVRTGLAAIGDDEDTGDVAAEHDSVTVADDPIDDPAESDARSA